MTHLKLINSVVDAAADPQHHLHEEATELVDWIRVALDTAERQAEHVAAELADLTLQWLPPPSGVRLRALHRP